MKNQVLSIQEIMHKACQGSKSYLDIMKKLPEDVAYQLCSDALKNKERYIKKELLWSVRSEFSTILALSPKQQASKEQQIIGGVEKRIKAILDAYDELYRKEEIIDND